MQSAVCVGRDEPQTQQLVDQTLQPRDVEAVSSLLKHAKGVREESRELRGVHPGTWQSGAGCQGAENQGTLVAVEESRAQIIRRAQHVLLARVADIGGCGRDHERVAAL